MIINCSGTLLDLNSPKVMAILNVSPDSFFQANSFSEQSEIISNIDRIIEHGADIIDIGAVSSKPGSKFISIQEEIARLKPALDYLSTLDAKPIISIDTCHSEVIKYAVDYGASMLNDISAGGRDGNLINTIAKLDIPYILMHMQGEPLSMQSNPHYENLCYDILKFFIQRIREAKAHGIKDLIIDPGFGFGKTMEHNYNLLNNISVFKTLDVPILAGLSRKSMIYKALHIDADKALNGTTALHMVALLNGANILRVHDVVEAQECIKLHQMLIEN